MKQLFDHYGLYEDSNLYMTGITKQDVSVSLTDAN